MSWNSYHKGFHYYNHKLRCQALAPYQSPSQLTLCQLPYFPVPTFGSDIFLQRWFPEVQNIYYQGNKRKQVPSNQNAKRLESFFNAAAVLMTNQLQMLALNSVDDFTKLFCPPAVSLSIDSSQNQSYNSVDKEEAGI